MTAAKKAPSGLLQARESFFRRTKRRFFFFLSKRAQHYFIQLVGGCLIVYISILLLNTPLMQRFENIFLDIFFRMRPPIQTSSNIVHIDMAEDSIQGIGRWPWARYNHAALVHILKTWGAKAIVFDVIFSDSSTTFDDESFAQAIKEAGNVYIAVMIETVDSAKTWIHSLPEFERYAKGIGYVNIYPDLDGVIRRVRPQTAYGGESYTYLGAKVAFDELGEDADEGIKKMPLDGKGDLLINWAARWGEEFSHYSFLDVLKSFSLIKEKRSPVIRPEEIKGKICVIGLTVLGLTDIKANPMQESYPGVGTQTAIMNSILTNQYVRPCDPAWNKWTLIVLGVFLSCFLMFFKREVSFAISLALAIAWLFITFVIFTYFQIWVYAVSPLMLILLLFIYSAICSFITDFDEQQRLFALATRDGLTGLYVIRHFRILLNNAVSEAIKKHQSLSMLILDLDFFKKINDTYGHAAGDVALKYVAEILRDVTKTENAKSETNVVARYGGEEFIILFKRSSLMDAAFNYAEKIRKRLDENTFTYEDEKIKVTVSIGVATLRPGETVPDLMVHRADEALYRAKHEGRNRVCLEEEGGDSPLLRA